MKMPLSEKSGKYTSIFADCKKNLHSTEKVAKKRVNLAVIRIPKGKLSLVPLEFSLVPLEEATHERGQNLNGLHRPSGRKVTGERAKHLDGARRVGKPP